MTTLPYEEDFSSGEFGDIYTYTVTGSKPWGIASGGAQANGFQGEAEEEHWMVLPGINFNIHGSEIMTFTTYAAHGTIDENNYLKLFYSSDYAGMGDPADASWTELTFDQPSPGAVGSTEVETPSGNIDLSSITGESVYLAFKYYSTNSPTRWRVDDINIYEDKDFITFYFRGPAWMDNDPHDPEVWGPFTGEAWTSATLVWDDELEWWSASVEVTDASAEITYQIRFAEDGATKFQKATGNFGADPTFTTTTGQIWIDGSENESYTWDGNDFYLAEGKITENQPALEPSNHATGFTAVADSPTDITLTWVDADPPAEAYLIKGSTTSFEAIAAPVNGVPEADGALVKNVLAGVETVVFEDLLPATTHYFKIFPYNGEGTARRYKTDGAVPEASATTEVAPLPPGLPYAQDFSTFVFADNTELTSFGGEEYKEWAFDATGSSADKVLYKGDWGFGTAGGFRGNASVLGYQHTGTTGVFSAELTLLNNSGATIQNLLISYDGMVERADQDRSPEWTVEINGVETPALAYSTDDGVDKKVTALVQNLNIENNTTFTIKWSSDRGFNTTGSSKQIGIGDVRVSVPSLYTLVGAADEASNYDGGWNHESNEGYGFGDWNLYSDGEDSGHFVGNSTTDGHGNINSENGTAFGLFGNNNEFANAERSISHWTKGATFSIQLATNWRDGSRGISLFNPNGFSEGDEIWNFNVSNSGYGATEWGFQSDMVLLFEITQEGNNLSIDVTGSSASASWTETTNYTVSDNNLGGFRLYTGGHDLGTDGQRNLYVNKLFINTDPSGIPNDATVLVKGQVDLDANLETENLIIEEGHLLRVTQGTELDVTGSILNYEGIDGLIIADGGSLIHNSNDVPATMEREISFGGWHMIAAPVSGMTILGSD
ncbi:MAG: DUF5017 domain-containing protein, partial [Bacteroidales bacterium]|nr:DUF5017 domain-containing protein [Bacteroidales bacterium]